MFQDTLLESSAQARRRKRWPMATAFLLEVAIAVAIVAVPLVSTGVIPVFARPPIIAPRFPIPLADMPLKPSSSGTGRGHGSGRPAVVTIASCSGANCIHIGNRPQLDEPGPPTLGPRGDGDRGPNLIGGNSERPRQGGPGAERLRLSNPSEAQLIKRVDPVYPRIAQLTGISGMVKLHAIIAKDGSIQSLSVISGHPMLAPAALEAVRQWQYRPYRLNGEAVEVETFITVNFRRER
jgi:periplasmic protein TonB